MKTTKRMLFGLFSSLLLAIGFARAADVLDPISRSLSAADQDRGALLASLDCDGMPCNVDEHQS